MKLCWSWEKCNEGSIRKMSEHSKCFTAQSLDYFTGPMASLTWLSSLKFIKFSKVSFKVPFLRRVRSKITGVCPRACLHKISPKSQSLAHKATWRTAQDLYPQIMWKMGSRDIAQEQARSCLATRKVGSRPRLQLKQFYSHLFEESVPGCHTLLRSTVLECVCVWTTAPNPRRGAVLE